MCGCPVHRESQSLAEPRPRHLGRRELVRRASRTFTSVLRAPTPSQTRIAGAGSVIGPSIETNANDNGELDVQRALTRKSCHRRWTRRGWGAAALCCSVRLCAEIAGLLAPLMGRIARPLSVPPNQGCMQCAVTKRPALIPPEQGVDSVSERGVVRRDEPHESVTRVHFSILRITRVIWQLIDGKHLSPCYRASSRNSCMPCRMTR